MYDTYPGFDRDVMFTEAALDRANRFGRTITSGTVISGQRDIIDVVQPPASPSSASQKWPSVAPFEYVPGVETEARVFRGIHDGQIADRAESVQYSSGAPVLAQTVELNP